MRLNALVGALLVGCAGSVMPEYREARLAALADPGPPENGWSPDAVLHLSPEAVDALVEGLLRELGTLTGTLDAGVATLQPRLDVTSLTLRQARECEECLAVDLSLDGSVAVESPFVRTRSPVQAQLAFDAVFEATPDVDGTWRLGFVPRRVRDVRVTIDGNRLDFLDASLRTFLDEQLLADLPIQHLASLGGGELPIRAVRVSTAGRTLQLQMLTRSPRSAPVEVDDPKPARWQLDLGTETLVGLAAAEAYRAGPVARDVVAVPTSLTVHREGRFSLGLRLWRIKGRGWWRDYVIEGRTHLEGDEVRLAPDRVVEAGKSKGAVVVDPLAFLAEGAILNALERVLATSVPSTRSDTLGGLHTRVALERLAGDAETLSLVGSLEIEDQSPR